MFKWLSKLKIWKRSSSTPPEITTYDYGRYVYKPVAQRALSEVMGMSQTELVNRMTNGGMEVYLNEDSLDVTHLVLRLESGSYEVWVPELSKIWRFFIL
jgi:hypothetical protein